MIELMKKGLVTNMTEFFEHLRIKYMCNRTAVQRMAALNDISLPSPTTATVDDIKHFVKSIKFEHSMKLHQHKPAMKHISISEIVSHTILV